MAWITTLSAKRLQLLGGFVLQTIYYFLCFSKIKQFPEIKYSISICSWMWAIEHVLEPCMLLFISNVCLKYAPKWMVSSSIFQKFSGEGLTEPPPQTPPPISLGLTPSGSGFALNSRALLPPMLERNLCMYLTKFFQPPLGNQLPPYAQFPSYGACQSHTAPAHLTIPKN